MTEPVSILSVAEAFPPHRLLQAEVVGLCRDVFAGRPEMFARLEEAYGNAGVETRSSCVPIEWYNKPHGWPERAALFQEHALALLETAATEALSKAGLTPRDVDTVVAVSTTGITTPSLDAHLLNSLGFRSDINRLPIFGLGCVGGVTGLARAADMAKTRPGQTVLLLVVELCALTFRPQELTKANIIASALFGDGAAAIVLRSGHKEGAPARYLGSAEHTWPDSLGIMGWRVEDDGLGVIFSRDIPALVRQDVRPAMERFLNGLDFDLSALAGIIAHPGGRKVLEAYEGALGLAPDVLRHSRDVLKDQGNMSAVTALCVLNRAIEAGDKGLHAMLALGPGFTAGFGLVDLG